MKKSLIVGSLLALGIGAGPAAAQELEELNFGIISTESSQALQESFQPFLDDMSAALGMPVRPFFAPRLRGRHRGHALRQGRPRLVRQQVRHGGGGSRRR
jgi:phosphonate transport system substrate-binding protein